VYHPCAQRKHVYMLLCTAGSQQAMQDRPAQIQQQVSTDAAGQSAGSCKVRPANQTMSAQVGNSGCSLLGPRLTVMGFVLVLQTVPTCPALYRNTFTYHTVEHAPPDFEECFKFLGKAAWAMAAAETSLGLQGGMPSGQTSSKAAAASKWLAPASGCSRCSRS
jgi:hypothetical protein